MRVMQNERHVFLQKQIYECKYFDVTSDILLLFMFLKKDKC